MRLLCATGQTHRFETVTAVLDCAGHSFTAKGKTVLQAGWKDIERLYCVELKQKPEEKGSEDAALPELKENQIFSPVVASVWEGKTSPPKHYTEDSLLAAMETAGAEDKVNCSAGAREGGLDCMPEAVERKGLGTPATRASTLEKLVAIGFVERKKKQLLPTEKGMNLIAVLPDNIKSPRLTAEWESRLKQVERGEISAESFMGGIADMSRALVKEHTAPEERFASLFPDAKGKRCEAIGTCPRCGGTVYEGKKGFFCENRDCSFALWKDNKFFSSKKKTLTKTVAGAVSK